MEFERCCFTGHRKLAPPLLPALCAQLDATLLALYNVGCRHFYAGGAMGFDTLAAERTLLLRNTYPSLALHLLLPCRGQTGGWPTAELFRYEALLAQCDSYQYISEQYSPSAMATRNHALVAHADVCVAFLQQEASGTGQTVRAAKKASLTVINLADKLPSNQTNEVTL